MATEAYRATLQEQVLAALDDLVVPVTCTHLQQRMQMPMSEDFPPPRYDPTEVVIALLELADRKLADRTYVGGYWMWYSLHRELRYGQPMPADPFR